MILAVDRSVSVDKVAAAQVAASVVDPELPVLTLADLGVLRGVEIVPDGRVIVAITPTYSGCPALDEMRVDLRNRLAEAGYDDVEIRTVLHPAWTTDMITPAGRRKLAEHGIAPPNPVGSRPAGPIPLQLSPPRHRVECPHCGSANTVELSRFSSTACKALRRCDDCLEPFEHMKEL